MKKLICLLLVMSLMSLCGCAALEDITEDLPPVPTAAPAVESMMPEVTVAPGVTETEHQHIIINFDKTEQQAYDPQQGTELILSFSYETPYVHIPGNAAAEEKINEFIAMLDESFYTGDDYGVSYDSGCAPGYNNMLTSAEDNYNYVVGSGIEYGLLELANHRSVSVQRCDDNVLSLLYYDYINLGGVHGGYAYRAYNFDPESGELLTMDSISGDEEFKTFLTNYMISTVEADEELQQRMMGFVDAEGMPTMEEALTALVREGSWYFDDEGLVIFSDLYELCSYAGGIIDFRISYDELEGYVKDEYIAEENTETATFSAVPAEELLESSKEIIDMLKIYDDGQAIYLIADGLARNVRITAVDYADTFYETERIWYCSVMNDCAVQLVTIVPEGMPDLKISYTDASGEHNLYLSQSGLDGSLLLVDEGIEAVG